MKHTNLNIGLLLFIGISLSFLFWGGCATIPPADTSTVTYISEKLTYNQFRNSQISILPVLAGQGYEGFRRQTGENLTSSLKKYFPNLTVYSNSETMERINSEGLSDGYSSLIKNYEITGITDKNILAKLGASTKSKYLLHAKVGSFQSSQTTYLENTPITTSVNEIAISCQLWDTELGDIVWQGTGGGAGPKNGKDSDISNLLRIAADGLASRIAKPINELPVSKTASQLNNEIMSNATAPYYIISILGSLLLIVLSASL